MNLKHSRMFSASLSKLSEICFLMRCDVHAQGVSSDLQLLTSSTFDWPLIATATIYWPLVATAAIDWPLIATAAIDWPLIATAAID